MQDGGRVTCLSDVLCFMLSKFGKTDIKMLRLILCDFYNADVLSAAKFKLTEALDKMSLSTKYPHISQRRDGRDGGERLSREVDDLISLFTFIDEQKLFDNLPIYVSNNPDNMPSIRLYEGDMNAFMSIVRNLRGKVDEYGGLLATIAKEVNEVKALSTAKPAGNTTAPCVPADKSVSIAASGVDIPGNRSTATDWPAIASTPNCHGSRFAVLGTDDDDSRPFTVVTNRRSTKRARERSSPSVALHPSTSSQRQQLQPQPPPQQQKQRPSRRPPTMYGKGANVLGAKIAAAKRIPKKAVFCIDNVQLSCSEWDIRNYVSHLTVEVFTCFEVISRRRRDDADEDAVNSRKAFRVCIHADDRDKLLNPDAWPDSVTVSPWYFKNVNTRFADKRARASVSSDDAGSTTVTKFPSHASSSSLPVNPPAAAAAAANDNDDDTSGNASTGSDTAMDQDNTILAEYNMNDGTDTVAKGINNNNGGQ